MFLTIEFVSVAVVLFWPFLWHSYPFCWRSDTPLIYKAVPSWFVAVESIREKLLKNNAETYWVPAFVNEKRFQNWWGGKIELHRACWKMRFGCQFFLLLPSNSSRYKKFFQKKRKICRNTCCCNIDMISLFQKWWICRRVENISKALFTAVSVHEF